MADKKSIAIIGGGISGLSAGIYALRNGYSATIYEKNPYVGGFCTAWERKGYHLDGCIHWLTGTHEGTDLCEQWKEVGVFSSQEDLFYQEDWGTYEYEGTKITVYCDLNKFKDELIDISPNDEKEINKLIKLVKKASDFPLPLDLPTNLMSPFRLLSTGLSMVPFLPFYLSKSKMSCEEYALRFKHPAIRHLITHMQIGPGSLYSMLYSFATVAYKNGGIPKGGSLTMSKNMLETYLKLGGKITTNCDIKDIEITNKEIKSIVDNKGNHISADFYISTVPINVLLSDILKDKYKDSLFDKKLNDHHKFPVPSAFIAYFAINKKLLLENIKTFNYSFNISPVKVGARNLDSISIRSYAYDEYFTKGENTVFEVMIDQYGDDFDCWEKVYKDKNKYQEEKKRVVTIIIDELEKHFSSLKGKIEFLDAFSPMTLNRYSGTYKGAYMPFLINKESRPMFHEGKIKDITNLYVGGQWANSPGGLPMALEGGRYSIMRILKDEYRNYVLNSPKRYKLSSNHS